MKALNDYDKIYNEYDLSNTKPDKAFSHLPSVLSFVGGLSGKIVCDLGCGSGFYAAAFSESGAKKVFGIDNSEEQLNLARKNQMNNIEYIQADIFVDKLPKSDIVCAPYVINYSKSKKELEKLIRSVYESLNTDGTFVGVIDLPNNADLTQYGAKKTLFKKEDEEPINIDIFNNGEKLCTLHAVYYTKETIEEICADVGFTDFEWRKPIVSSKGIEVYGQEYWDKYCNEPELGYFVVYK